MNHYSKNEHYLLKFISDADYDSTRNSDILDVVSRLGIKLQFKNSNPVYQIIDELNYSALIGK